MIFKSQNKGPVHARNVGIKRASHDLVAFIDDDVIVTPDWIEKIRKPILNGNKNLVGVGDVVLALKKHIMSQYYVIHKILEAPKQLNYLPTVNYCFKRDHLMDIGGFNTAISFTGGENTDLCLRLKEKAFIFKKFKMPSLS